MFSGTDIANLKGLMAESITDVKMQDVREALLASDTQVECPTTDYFAKGQYVREMFMAAGLVVLGHTHKVSTINILAKGKVLIYNGVGAPLKVLEAPYVYTTEAGVQKLAYVVEDATWLNCFPTHETDVNVIMSTFTDKKMKELT